MKIWLDTAPASQFANDDCGNDCNDCRSHTFGVGDLFSTSRTALPDIHTHLFRQAPSLYCNSHDDGQHWLVCNTAGNGQVAVIDAQALSLLEEFRVPKTIDEIVRRTDVWSARAVLEATSLFHHLGLLQDYDQLELLPEKNNEETLSAWLHITNACTLRCPYCYLDKTSEHMADDTARRSVDAIFRSATRNHFKRVLLKYAGGEASLQMGNVLAIHRYATQLAQHHAIDLHAYIMSNGVFLPQNAIEQLKELNIGLMISLDGIGASHDNQRPFISGNGSFKYVDRTISRLLVSGLIPHINVTVSQRNLVGLPDLTHYILEHGLSFTFSYYRDNECSTHIRDLQFADVQMIEGMQKAFDVIEQHLPWRRFIDSLIDKASMKDAHQHTCGAGRTYLVIDQHGQVAKCHANIKQAVTTIDAADPLQIIRDDRSGMQAIAVEEKQGCRTCEWRYWCSGGCPLLTYRITGRNDVKSPNCTIYKALFPKALRLEALRLLKYETPIVWQ